MKNNIYKYRRLKWGDPEKKLDMLYSFNGKRKNKPIHFSVLIISSLLLGFTIVSFGVKVYAVLF